MRDLIRDIYEAAAGTALLMLLFLAIYHTMGALLS